MKPPFSVNPFAPLSKEEKGQKERDAQELKAHIIGVKEKARICLRLEEFSDYTKRYKDAEAVLIQRMIDLDCNDPMQEWKEFKELQVKLKVIRSLMVDVNKDAK